MPLLLVLLVMLPLVFLLLAQLVLTVLRVAGGPRCCGVDSSADAVLCLVGVSSLLVLFPAPAFTFRIFHTIFQPTRWILTLMDGSFQGTIFFP